MQTKKIAFRYSAYFLGYIEKKKTKTRRIYPYPLVKHFSSKIRRKLTFCKCRNRISLDRFKLLYFLILLHSILFHTCIFVYFYYHRSSNYMYELLEIIDNNMDKSFACMTLYQVPKYYFLLWYQLALKYTTHKASRVILILRHTKLYQHKKVHCRTVQLPIWFRILHQFHYFTIWTMLKPPPIKQLFVYTLSVTLGIVTSCPVRKAWQVKRSKNPIVRKIYIVPCPSGAHPKCRSDNGLIHQFWLNKIEDLEHYHTD